MTIAVPLFGSRVSPRFDCTSKMLFVDVEDGAALFRQLVTLPRPDSWAMAELLRERSVQVLICGGISCHLQGLVTNLGIKVISGVIGESEDAIEAFIAGTLQSGEFRKCRRRRTRRGTRWLHESD